jgi:flagellar biogenesis protein FliO
MKRPVTQHRHDGHGQRSYLAPVAITAALMAMVAQQAAWGDGMGAPPMPPLPDEVRAESTVQPASLEIATPLPLDGSRNSAGSTTRAKPTSSVGNWSVLAAIASAFVVLAAFRFWQSRRTVRELPGDVFEILGEAPLGNQHAVRVVRFGPRTLLVGISAAGCQTLAIIDDPQATERIVGACSSSRAPRSSRVVTRPSTSAGSTGVREAR